MSHAYKAERADHDESDLGMTAQALCSQPGCAAIASHRGRCAGHAREQRKASRSPFNSFYASKPWEYTRRRQLRDHPFCAECGQLAEVIHHVVALRDGGAPRDPKNLQSLCKPHHDSITRRGG
jgi:5-methylcytosine-specific restriction enzyme A